MLPLTRESHPLAEGHVVGMHAAPLLAYFAAGWLLIVALMPFDQTAVMRVNDLVMALLALGLCVWWVRTGTATPRWLLFVVGLWLLCAPLVFWAPHPLACLNDLGARHLLITASEIWRTLLRAKASKRFPRNGIQSFECSSVIHRLFRLVRS